MMSVFLFVPAMAISAGLERFAGIRQGPVPAIIVAALVVLVYFAMGSELRVTLDDRGMRVTRARVRFGMRGAETLLWEVPRHALTHAREVTTRVPSSRGGWNTGTRLHVGENVLESLELGSKDAPSSPYLALTRSLKQRLGDRFTVEQVT